VRDDDLESIGIADGLAGDGACRFGFQGVLRVIAEYWNIGSFQGYLANPPFFSSSFLFFLGGLRMDDR
jgi:hypothetical protein